MSKQFEAIRKACHVLFEEGQVVELRALEVPTGSGWTATFSGYFDDFDALAGAALDLDRRGAKGIYFTLNPVQSDLLARCKNKVKRCRKRDPLTKNEEIERRRWLLIDLDPERPKGISATEEEKRRAYERALKAARFLKEKGWPGGILADSGNGIHLLYPVDLPADDQGLTQRVLKALAEKFSGEAVELDTSVHNAARICKLYGTTARKGDETEERPHRRACILRVAEGFEPVPVTKLQALALKPTNGHGKTEQGKISGGLETEEIRRALNCIPSEPDYKNWLPIIAATLDATGGDVGTAEQLLKEWSPEEKPGEYRKKLTSGFNGSITTGTLIHEAEKHGYEPPWKRNGQKKRSKIKGGDESAETDASRKEMTQAERLLNYAEGVDLFHTPDGKTYASFEAGGAYRTAAIPSAAFGKYLRRLFYQAEGRPPSAQALQDARDVLSAQAEFDGEECEVHLRVAGHGRRVYIDLGNERWDLVEIDKGGWRIIRADNAPVRFRRTPGMKALPEPKRGGSLDLLRSHVRLMSDGEFALLLAWLLQALNPEGPYPALELTGEQGTGKSTTARLLRALIDPHRVPTRTRPREERDLMVAADNGWLLSFDNLSGLQHWLSDAFCRLATGGGFGTRKLYSDRTEEIFYSLRPLLLNGIEDLTTRPDLADRTVTLRLSPIPESERKTEKELRAKFEKDRPLILGALFDAVATALRNVEKTELEKLPRMADFARWGAAAEEAFPTEEGTFLQAYEQDRKEASEGAVEGSTVASAIRAMLEDRGEWMGRTSTLREDLKRYLPEPEKPPRDYPESYQAMGAELRRVMPVLRDVGIRREEGLGPKGRAFRLYEKEAESEEASASTQGEAEQRKRRLPQPGNGSVSSADGSASSEAAERSEVQKQPAEPANGDHSASSASSAPLQEKSNDNPWAESSGSAPPRASGSGAQLDPDSFAEGQRVFDLSRKKLCRIRHASGAAVVVEAIGSGGKLLGDTWTTTVEKLRLPTDTD